MIIPSIVEAQRLTTGELLEMSFEELVNLELTSVSFFGAVERKAPGTIFVITEDEISKSSTRTLNDIIGMSVPGMTTGGHQRHGPLIGTRGIFIDNNAKTMVMLDEQQINQRSLFGYAPGLLSPLLGDIQRTEVILGPGALLHGSGALNGFINMVPKNGEENPGLFFNADHGFVDDLWKVETGYGAPYGEGKDIYLYAGAYQADGFESDELYGSPVRDVQVQGYHNGNYRLSFYWNHEKFNLNTFFYENNPFTNSSLGPQYAHEATLGARPKYVYEISDTDTLEFRASFLWSDHSYPPFPIVQTFGGGTERHWESKNIYRTTRWENHSFATGFSVGEKNFYQLEQYFSEDTENAAETIDTSWRELSIFTEDIIELSEKWTASFGLRYDKVDLDKTSSPLWLLVFENDPGDPFKDSNKQPSAIEGHLSPRIATAYELDEETTLKAAYQHGFRAPDASYYVLNLMYRDAARSLGLDFPELGIETMDSFELNLRKNIPERKIKVEVNAFYNTFKDLISFQIYRDTGLFTPQEIAAIQQEVGVPPFTVGNIGSFLNEKDSITTRGGEIDVTFQPVSHTEIRANYGYVHSDEERMLYPKHQIKVNTLSSFRKDKINFSLSYLYNPGYSNSDLPNAHSIYRQDRHVVDTAVIYNVNPNLSIRAIVKNLFENDVPPMVFTPEAPYDGGLGHDERQVYVSLEGSV